ncbi:MAG: sugar ABC transporter permease [Anaerolineales bacterium]|nr:sugar ABC transporter permease [Anaerolineales bacterium]
MVGRFSRDRLMAIAVLLPSVILLAIFVYGFIAQTVYYSLTDWATMQENPTINFIGTRNYVDLFTNNTNLSNLRFRISLTNTIFFTLFFIALCLILGLALAILLDQKIRGESIFRTIFLFPMALSFVVTGTVWRWLFNPRSGFNTLPTVVGSPPLPPQQFPWMTDTRTGLNFSWGAAVHIIILLVVVGFIVVAVRAAMKRRPGAAVIAGIAAASLVGWFFLSGLSDAFMQVSASKLYGLNYALFTVVVAAVWQMSGYTMAMYLAGLRGIPEELREAARVDGCNEWGVYRHVVLPLLQPITLSAIIILGHISLKIFDLVFVMAGANNLYMDVPGVQMWTQFRGNNFSYGAAIAVVMLVLVALVIVPYLISQLRSSEAR